MISLETIGDNKCPKIFHVLRIKGKTSVEVRKSIMQDLRVWTAFYVSCKGSCVLYIPRADVKRLVHLGPEGQLILARIGGLC